MNYKLTKELKEAGFEQGALPTYCDTCKHPNYSDEGMDDCDCFVDKIDELDKKRMSFKEKDKLLPTRTYIPNLSELFDACGNYVCLVDAGKEWIAYWQKEQFATDSKVRSVMVDKTVIAYGATKEIAMAKLWLKKR